MVHLLGYCSPHVSSLPTSTVRTPLTWTCWKWANRGLWTWGPCPAEGTDGGVMCPPTDSARHPPAQTWALRADPTHLQLREGQSAVGSRCPDPCDVVGAEIQHVQGKVSLLADSPPRCERLCCLHTGQVNPTCHFAKIRFSSTLLDNFSPAVSENYKC